jgi:hypothetical protein
VSDPDLLARLASPNRAELRRACDEAQERVAKEPALREAVRELLRAPEPLARFAAAFVLFHAERPSLRLLPACSSRSSCPTATALAGGADAGGARADAERGLRSCSPTRGRRRRCAGG